MPDIELTAGQAKELHALDAAIQEMQAILMRAHRAGIDVAELQQALAEAETRRKGLLKEFPPGISARTRAR